MFTFHIKTLIQIGKTRVKWQTNAPAGTPQTQFKGDDYAELRKLWNETNREAFKVKLAEVTQRNEQNKKELLTMISTVVEQAESEGDTKHGESMRQFQKTVEESYTELAKANDLKKAEEQAKAKEALAGYSSVVGQAEQAKALSDILKGNTKNSIIEDLKDTNIASLLALVTTQSEGKMRSYIDTSWNTGNDIYGAIRTLGYSSNGTLGATELKAVKNFMEFYLTTSEDLKNKIREVSTYTKAGLSTTEMQKGITSREKIKDISSALTYLSDLPNARFRSQDIRTMLDTRKDKPGFIVQLAMLCGSSASDTLGLIADLKSNPRLKAQFFENINTAGANQISTLGALLDGKGALQATESAEKITNILTEKARGIRTDIQKTIASTIDPTEKAKIEAVLASYDVKGEKWITGEIRKVAEGAFVNIGRGANTAGVGVSYEVFLKGLTVSLGAGVSEGKVGPALVVHYDIASGKLTETEKKVISGSIGIGTSVFPAVIPFLDGSLKATDKLSVYGRGIGGVDSTGLSALISKGGGSLSLSFLNERKSEIDQGSALMTKVIDQFSTLHISEITADTISKIVSSQKGMQITPEEAAHWTTRLRELYRVNTVTQTTPSEAKAILIKGIVESEGEKRHTQEANNDVDGRSYKGFSIGVGHLFGVTFPLVGVSFKEGKVQYSYPEIISTERKESPKTKTERVLVSPGVPATKKEENSQQVQASNDALKSRETISNIANGIYVMSRRKGEFPLFDSALVKAGNGDYAGAIADLKKMPNSSVAKTLITYAEKNPEKIAIMNTFTYGGYGKNKEKFSKRDYAKARSDTIMAENKLSPGNIQAEAYFQSKENHSPISLLSKYPGQDISSSVFATPKGGTHRIDKYPGSVSVSHEIYEGGLSESQKTRLLGESGKSIAKNLQALNIFLGEKGRVTSEQYITMLRTGTLPNIEGLTFVGLPRFIEGRAMINGNICANRVEAIIFPTFSLKTLINVPGEDPKYTTITSETPGTSSFELDIGGAGFIASEVGSGLLASGYSTPETPVVVPTPTTKPPTTVPTAPPVAPPTVNPTTLPSAPPVAPPSVNPTTLPSAPGIIFPAPAPILPPTTSPSTRPRG